MQKQNPPHVVQGDSSGGWGLQRRAQSCLTASRLEVTLATQHWLAGVKTTRCLPAREASACWVAGELGQGKMSKFPQCRTTLEHGFLCLNRRKSSSGQGVTLQLLIRAPAQMPHGCWRPLAGLGFAKPWLG